MLLGVDDLQQIAIAYYPNPVSSVFHFNAKQPIVAVNILNMLGQRVGYANVNALSGAMDLTSLRTGNYIAEFSFEKATKKIKLIKQ
ncbi:T9SS type A sorting domain-containing protein [Flavobacterium sp. 3HN19-14]|uniref:T9SS type A sorting domain-containing protein n=1 Tax=Flavobacterium sp. 3HN19-14 TaxID=3448133 RepID=UPI003EE420A2